MLLLTLVGTAHAATGWRTQRIHRQFFAEGAAAGDIDGDGNVDLVAGPHWYPGPAFREQRELAPPREFSIMTYSDQFFSHVVDATEDGANDVLVLGFPGQSARLYVNPGRQAIDSHRGPWEMVEVADIVDNESPAIVRLTPPRDGDRLPQIVCGRHGQYGYYTAGKDATKPWKWTAVTAAGACAGRFAHGLGVGDVNGDGRLDLLDPSFWWEQPTDLSKPWKQHRWSAASYGHGGAQIEVMDVDDDGDADIVTSLNAHGYGLAWFEQTGEGEFRRHDIMGDSSLDNDFGVVFSQLHALEQMDVDGDGVLDLVTGKRWMAHQGKDPGGLQEPVLYWFRCVRVEGRVEFVPHLIHRDSGVGVDVLVTDLNQDQRPDVVSCSKHGLAVHFQDPTADREPPQRWKVSAGRDQSTYADGWSPSEAAQNMLTPAGFAVDLIASEPALTQPIAMCFDSRGRIWVVEGHTYPRKAPEGQGKDRVVIFEDADGDGSFESKKTFMTGINLASGIEVGFGGVWIGAAPELLFIPDANQDDVPDGEPEVLLDGWGYHDTHETLNSFTWGPDGWLYGCQGVFTHSRVGKPGTPDEERVPLNAGVWRYHPTRRQFEVFAHGTSNPWGVDFNDRGEWFVSACVIPHLFHIQQGARYRRQAGQHFNPHTYDDVKTIADHLHYSGAIQDHAFWGENRNTKPSAPLGTSQVGGGHAHCGLAIYNGDAFPQEYYGDLFFHNLHGHRLVREEVEDDGSGYVGRHRPDFALAQDHKEIGVGVMVGPDGALYTSDWHDIQTCHNGQVEIWDRTNGRLFRIRHGDLRPQQFNLWTESDEQLVQRLQSDNGFFSRQARRVLQERAAAGKLDLSTVMPKLLELTGPGHSQRDRLRAIWTCYCVGVVDHGLIKQWLGDEDEYVRAWAYYLAAASYTDGSQPYDFARHDFRDSSAAVRRYQASLAQRMPLADRWPLVEYLATQRLDAQDRNLPLLVWYALEPLAASEPDRAYQLAARSPLNLLRFVIRRTSATAAGREMLVKRLADETSRPQFRLILEELMKAATARGGVKMPASWRPAYEKLANGNDEGVRVMARSLAVQFGDEAVLPYFRGVYANPKETRKNRLDALAVLRQARDPQLPEQIFQLLGDEAVTVESIAALAQYRHPLTADSLLQRFGKLNAAGRTAALNTLVARSESAAKLVDAMEAGSVAPQTVPAFIVRQAMELGSEALVARLEKVWGRITASSKEKQGLYKKYRTLLTANAIGRASASRGRVVYEANCGKCHKLFGTGGDIGPDITGANRNQVNYWLENILEPNALIGKAYQVTAFRTDNGQVVNGIVKEENEDAVTVQTATEKVVLRKDAIERRKLSETSLMPQRQMEPMTDRQVLDLFAYLMGPSQVEPAIEIPRRPGTVVIEGEAMEFKVDAGVAKPQAMGGFGSDWSKGRQLWWTSGKRGAKFQATLNVPAGEYDVALYLTKANDYAQTVVSGNVLSSQPTDLYATTVRLSAPLVWRRVTVKQDVDLVIEITGANPQARPSLMVGIDRIEFIPAAPEEEEETK